MAKGHRTKLTKHLRQAKVAEIFIENPYISPAEIAEILSVNKDTVSNDVKDITERLNRESLDTYNMHRERILKEITGMKLKCKNKLALCKGAIAGSRWVEEWTKLIEKECKILGVYAPDRALHAHAHIHADEKMTKERRDAVVEAILIGHEKGIIKVGAAAENK